MSTPEEPRVSLSEIARQMREQRNADQSKRQTEARENRTAQPQLVESQPALAQPANQAPVYTGLRALAFAHRLQTIACGLIVLSFLMTMVLTDPIARAEGKGSAATDYAILASIALFSAASWWLVFRLFRWSGSIVLILLGFLLIFAPMGVRIIFAILAFFLFNGIAARRLRKAGAKVGFLGVSPSSLPE